MTIKKLVDTMNRFLFSNKKILLGLSLIATGCTVTGRYTYTAYNTDIVLELHSDKSFVEKIYLNHEADTFSGIWEIDKKILSRKIIFPKVYFEEDSSAKVEEFIKPNTDSIFFKVFLDNQDSLLSASIFLNNNTQDIISSTDSRGKAAIKKQNITSFTVGFLSGPSVNHFVKNKNSNVFRIYANSKKIPEKITRMNPTIKFLIKRNKLLPLDYNGSIRKDYYLKKHFLRIKLRQGRV